MEKPPFKSHSSTRPTRNRRSLIRLSSLVAGIFCSILLPFYLLDEFHCLSFPERSGNSVFTNALRFYSGNDEVNPDRFIAIVTYIGLPGDSDMEATKSHADEIIRTRVMPAFERNGLRFKLETNEITNLRFYYKKELDGSKSDVKVFCFVTSKAAFALVVG